MIDCATCGGLIPTDRRCCPHCHCQSSAWKRWALVASATVGLTTASCNDNKKGTPDLATPRTIQLDAATQVVPTPAYGPPPSPR